MKRYAMEDLTGARTKGLRIDRSQLHVPKGPALLNAYGIPNTC